MKYELVEVNKHFELQKGISYTSKQLVDDSETGLLTINAFIAGGGFKLQSEKPYVGDLKSEYLLSDGDVLLAMTEQDAGLLASPLTIKSDYSKFSNLTFSLDVAKVISTSGEVDPNFLYNVLRIPAFRKRAAYGDTGSTVQRLPYEAFGELKIPRPPLDVQKAIIKIIDDIDSKIYLNKKTSESLEQIAQTIFKSWFVDFDPVHAKARGEQPEGMDAETAALFPDSFEESELGLIPAGWVLSKVGECFRLNYGKALKSENRIQGKCPVFGSNGVVGSHFEALVHQGHLVIGRKGTVGSVNLSQGPSWPIDTAFYVIPETEFGLFFAYFLFRSLGLEGMDTDAAVPGLNRDNVHAQLFVRPSKETLAAYDKFVRPLFALQEIITMQSQVLTEVRETLLPMLISGELQIPDELLGD